MWQEKDITKGTAFKSHIKIPNLSQCVEAYMSSSTTHNEIGEKVAYFLYNFKEGEVISQFQKRLLEKRVSTAQLFCSQGDPPTTVVSSSLPQFLGMLSTCGVIREVRC